VSNVFVVAPYSPVGKVEDLFPGTWYLLHIDEKHRRTYERKKLHGAENGLQLWNQLMEQLCSISTTHNFICNEGLSQDAQVITDHKWACYHNCYYSYIIILNQFSSNFLQW